MKTSAIITFLFGALALVAAGIFMARRSGNEPPSREPVSPTSTGSQGTSTVGMNITDATFRFTVADPRAGTSVRVNNAVVINPSWIAIFEAQSSQPVGVPFGAVFFDRSNGPQSNTIRLSEPLVAGKSYVGVLYEDDGDGRFDPVKEFAIIRPDGERAFEFFTPAP